MSENNGNENSAITTDLIINRKQMEGDSSFTKFEFESTHCQQKSSSPRQKGEILNRHAVRSSLLDFTNISIPPVQSRPATLHFAPLDHSSTSSASLKHLQFTSSLYVENRNRFSQITSSIWNKSCSNGSNSFADHMKTKQMRCQNPHQRAFNKLRRLKNILGTSGCSSIGKFYNLLPITRRSDTVNEHSAIEKFRGDDEEDFENLENEFSFRAYLQSTSRSTLISSSLPSTSTPNKLESRYKKRPPPDEANITGSAKKVKDESMEEGNDGRTGGNLEEEMDIDMAEPSSAIQDSRCDDEGKSEEDISFPLALFNRSHSSSFSEIGENKEPEPPSHLDVQYELEILRNPDNPSSAFACISADTLANLLNSMTMIQFSERFILVDCRYPFEFKGGHIRGANNLFDPLDIEAFFYPQDVQQRTEIMRKKLIFYCEFSQKRGPSIAYELRALDRKFNVNRYPRVDYPEMYLLEYGYRNFYLRFGCEPSLIEPEGYVAMNDAAHIEELKNYKYHRIRTVASVYHTLARDRHNRQRMGISPMNTPTRVLPRQRLFLSSPESPSEFPTSPIESRILQGRGEETPDRLPPQDTGEETPKSRPLRDRLESKRRRSVCRRLFNDDDFDENDEAPGPSSSNTF